MSGRIVQPFGMKMFRNIFWRHRYRALNKTVMVKDGKVDEAFRLLNRLMGDEGLIDIYRRTRYFEYPYQQRNRRSYEMCRAIYDEDMRRKIEFVMRKNRKDPFPGQQH